MVSQAMHEGREFANARLSPQLEAGLNRVVEAVRALHLEQNVERLMLTLVRDAAGEIQKSGPNYRTAEEAMSSILQKASGSSRTVSEAFSKLLLRNTLPTRTPATG